MLGALRGCEWALAVQLKDVGSILPRPQAGEGRGEGVRASGNKVSSTLLKNNA